jgi:hypothetical protein
MKGKRMAIIAASVLALVALTPVTSAFSDIKGTKGEHHIIHLKDRGIVKGNAKGSDAYHPHNKLSYAQAAVLLDEAFELSLAAYTFVKQPLASDYYTKVKDNQWYSQAFVDGYYNGVVFDKNVNPNSPISREEFAAQLLKQVDSKVDYALIKMYVGYKDVEEGKEEYKDEIQKLLLLKFAELDKNDKFNPTKPITREEAAIWLDRAITFVDEKLAEQEAEASVLQDVNYTLTEVNKNVNKVTVSATVPHPGYGIAITSIMFEGDTAHIVVSKVDPDPDKMYPQVIATATVDTYLDSNYKKVLITTVP